MSCAKLEKEGLKITELAVIAGVSTKTIQALEHNSRNVTPEMKHKILNALNGRDNKQKKYAFEDMFFDDPQV